MEDQGRPATLMEAPARPSPAATARPGPPDGGWIVSPAYDLLLVANLGWLLLLAPGMVNGSRTAVDFWQVYFLTLPHRWVTLILVLLDPDRREGQGARLALIAAASLAVVVGVRFWTGAFTCLAVVDYLWNAWHFAAQHSGVLRIYSRKVGGGSELLERAGVRLFVTYAALRTAGWTTGWLEADPATLAWLRAADVAVLAVPLALVLSVVVGLEATRAGKAAYVLSVCGLYSGLILSLSFRQTGLVVAFATASGLFHAVEYLAVVTHYARRRRTFGSPGLFRLVAADWILYLGAYLALLGAAGVWAEGLGRPFGDLWKGLNLWMAFVHYGFDGMIWKLRRPATSRALGIERIGSARP